IEQLPLVHFRVMPGTETPFEESVGAMFDMQKTGKIRHVGVSCVTPGELSRAMYMGKIASVENVFGHGQRSTFSSYGRENRGMLEVMSICRQHNIAMIPYWSLESSLKKADDRIKTVARKYGATAAQINLAWLLQYDNLLLPIPGTSKLKHFEENCKAFEISLTAEDMQFLE
ncbi:MAG TPA: aldo/keto reductase, partial [Puia sp.]|nr:aldo/keto reductase [Puia sp.]